MSNEENNNSQNKEDLFDNTFFETDAINNNQSNSGENVAEQQSLASSDNNLNDGSDLMADEFLKSSEDTNINAASSAPSLFDGEDGFFQEIKAKEEAVIAEIKEEKFKEQGTNHSEESEDDIFCDEDIFAEDEPELEGILESTEPDLIDSNVDNLFAEDASTDKLLAESNQKADDEIFSSGVTFDSSAGDASEQQSLEEENTSEVNSLAALDNIYAPNTAHMPHVIEESDAYETDTVSFIPSDAAKLELLDDDKKSNAFTYSEDLGLAALASSGEKKALDNRTIFIVLAVFLLFLGVWFYQNLNNRYGVEADSGRKRSKVRTISNLRDKNSDTLPVWEAIELSKEELESPLDFETQFISRSVNNAGRRDPFSLPSPVIIALADLDKADEQGLKSSKPKKLNKKAYRVSLVGVLGTALDRMALVNVKEAEFEVAEDLEKDKVLKAATRAMRSAKDDTLELNVGDYIGNWLITQVQSPDNDTNTIPKIVLVLDDQEKIILLGEAEELGIFNDKNELDDLSEFAIEN